MQDMTCSTTLSVTRWVHTKYRGLAMNIMKYFKEVENMPAILPPSPSKFLQVVGQAVEDLKQRVIEILGKYSSLENNSTGISHEDH